MVEDGKKHSTMTNLKSCLTAVFESAVDEDVSFEESCQKSPDTTDGSKKACGYGSGADKAIYGVRKE